jgi:Do/DeqQ family serine protease
MKSNIFTTLIVAVAASALTFLGMEYLTEDSPQEVVVQHVEQAPVKGAMYTVDEEGKVVPLDFEKTAAVAMESVVYIQSKVKNPMASRQQEMDPFRRFFEQEGFPFGNIQPQRRQQPQYSMGSGSGVIINENGYIVTNNHVIDKAAEIEVTLHDNRSYAAKVIGTDPTTDLALLQIQAENLQALPLVNSDDVNVGQWVMAVGNPFNLTSTATAGIVSAKARNLNINGDRYAVESFIQTDAAINRGNSGGALVNLEGGLVGINTALISPTGAYSGYGFAIPSNLVSKVIEDLLEYGAVQRGYLGVMIRDVNADLVKAEGLKINDGVYIDSVMTQSAAEAAGLQSGDVVVAVNDDAIKTTPELQERVARFRPGDELKLTVLRKQKEKDITVILQGADGDTEIAQAGVQFQKLGIEVQDLTEEQQQASGLESGVYVVEVQSGIISRATSMRPGFIITRINDQEVDSVEEFQEILSQLKGGALVEGRYEDMPGTYYYGFGLDS